MKKLLILAILSTVCLFGSSHSQESKEKELTFYLLWSEDELNTFVVMLKRNNRLDYYQIGKYSEDPNLGDHPTPLTVYYDTVSRNFYTLHDGKLTIIKINRPYKLAIVQKADIGKQTK